MDLFPITPRYSDDDFFRMADELVHPFFYNRRRVPSAMLGFGDFTDERDSEIHNTDKEFRVRVDLRHYKPEEVKITSDHHRVTIHAKHEEKQDRHGYVSRMITRSYKIPEDVDPKSITSTMNSQGVLSVKAVKKAIEAPKETPIAVEFKGH